MRKLLAFLIVPLGVSLGTVAEAQTSGSHYDWQSGNSYQWNRDRSGTSLRGFNYNTGGQWNIRQNNDGSYYGRDTQGNYFQGNHNSGYYNNLGTGRLCTGTGAGRICN